MKGREENSIAEGGKVEYSGIEERQRSKVEGKFDKVGRLRNMGCGERKDRAGDPLNILSDMKRCENSSLEFPSQWE